MRQKIWLVAVSASGLAVTTANAQAPQQALAADPPARAGRLAFIEGNVSFHDSQQTDWSPAVVNTTLVSGEALWTEPNARSEISIAGTRVRMDGASELDVVALDDSQTRLQLDQGRIDVRTFTYDAQQPYQIVTPRGVITLQQQGDYYVLAGTTDDPTELGVRSGAAQIQAINGQVLAVRAGEIGVVTGDNTSPQLHTMQTAPPPMPEYWAERDRTVYYNNPQYLSYGVTGYEDLNAYGGWSADPEYGQVWIPNNVSADWQPYSTGRWNYVQAYGWSWVDDQPWGFAPYHYGRWAHRNDGRWMWVAPDREQRPVYAPALVAFIGGVELSVAIGQQNAAPVGWFPLGPREAYVPPYTRDREYFRRLNASARVEDRVMEERWQRAERHEALRSDQQANNQRPDQRNEPSEQFANRRFATVVPAQAFVRSEDVHRAALKVDPQKISSAPVAPVSAPPATAQANVATPAVKTNIANMATIGRPTGADAPRREAPGPKIASRPNPTTAPNGKPELPQLTPHNPNAPKPATVQGVQNDNKAQPNATTPQAQQPAKPGEPTKPNEAAKPGEPPKPNEAAKPGETKPAQAQPNQAQPNGLPPVRSPQAQRPAEPAKPGEAQRPNEQHPAQAQPQHTEPQHPAAPAQAQRPPEPPKAEPPKAEPPKPERQGENRAPAQAPQQHAAPQPQQAPPQHVAPPPPQQAQQPAPQPQQHQAPPQQQAQQPHPQPAPQVQPQHQASPPPEQHQQQAQQPAPQQHPAPAQQQQKKEEEKK